MQVRIADTGISRPKIVEIHAMDGSVHRQIVKGRDDLRQDAVVQQLFKALNRVFDERPNTRQRSLQLRTYTVHPLSPQVGGKLVRNLRTYSGCQDY